MKSITHAGLALAFALSTVAACGTSSTTAVSTTTTGQQLLDLKKALDSGAITQKEYDRQRGEILKR